MDKLEELFNGLGIDFSSLLKQFQIGKYRISIESNDTKDEIVRVEGNKFSIIFALTKLIYYMLKNNIINEIELKSIIDKAKEEFEKK